MIYNYDNYRIIVIIVNITKLKKERSHGKKIGWV